MEPMYVICFYWEGDRWQSRLDLDSITDPSYAGNLKRVGEVSLDLASKYVDNLYQGVKRFATRPFEFICFTNEQLTVGKDIELRPFKIHTQAGVLPRVFMFSEEAGLGNHQVLCLDLDIIIVGDMTSLMNYEGRFCARSKFKPGEEWKLDGDIMSFRAGKETADLFWKPFVKDVDAAVKLTQGRERYWVRHVADDFADRWDTKAPGAVLSYKRHRSKMEKLPREAAIVSCHGYPRPHQVNRPWIKEFWK